MTGEAKFVSWREDFALGVGRIDAEHRFFFELLNELFASVIRGRGEEETLAILRRLAAYADVHFAGEERALAEAGCPCHSLQQVQHAMFRRNLRTIGESTVRSRAMLDFMRDWLVLHILETDRRCVPWLGRSATPAARSPSRSVL
jgi:hemerythrin-like metal-binding protein